jgi:hypothetical protein
MPVTIETTLFLLRILAGLLIMGMLITLLFFLWRDYHASEARIHAVRRPYGRLTEVRDIDGTIVVAGESFPLLPLTSLGRSVSNAVTIDDTFVSGEHALIALRNGQWWLEDRQSRNGTSLNDLPVTQPVIITDGDIIGIGQKRYRVELES